jgi:hypothetical protein
MFALSAYTTLHPSALCDDRVYEIVFSHIRKEGNQTELRKDLASLSLGLLELPIATNESQFERTRFVILQQNATRVALASPLAGRYEVTIASRISFAPTGERSIPSAPAVPR